MAYRKQSRFLKIKRRVFNNPPKSIYLTLQDVYEAKEMLEEEYGFTCDYHQASFWFEPEQIIWMDANAREWSVNGPFQMFVNSKLYAAYSLACMDSMLELSEDVLDLHNKIDWLCVQDNKDGFIQENHSTNYTILIEPNIYSYTSQQ